MIELWVLEDVRRAVHKGKTKIRVLVERGDIPVYARTPTGMMLFSPDEVQLYITGQPPRDAVRNRFGEPVIVDEAGRCTDCGQLPTKCLAERH